MGKRAKEHRKKVAKRNAQIELDKQKMKKMFDQLLQKQQDLMLNEENTKIKLGEKELNFEVLGEIEDKPQTGIRLNLDPEESAKINQEFEDVIVEDSTNVENQISELEK